MTLAAEALDRAALVYGWIAKVDVWMNSGAAEDQAKARAIISQLAHVTAGEVPVIKGIVATHRQAAQAFDRTQHSLAPFFLGHPEEHPNTPANDHAASLLSPRLPSPDRT